jgi:hypothetical protein
MVVQLLNVIIGCYLASKYDCDNYLVSEKEQLRGAIGIYLLVIGSILLPLTFIFTLNLIY